ncbi:MAG: PEGA domain-containing protein [Candidatus Coatesbacteria bacterium]|nr:PEGA domain-containing protein [Candidatus Coatesbacteria bacterium]
MLKNKWFMVVVVVLAVLVITWQFVPWLMERSKRGAPTEAVSAPAPIEQTAPELNVEAPSRGAGQAAPFAASAATGATAAAPQVGWISQLAIASRDTSRSPFQRKNEGLGKIFIRSRPSDAEIYLNGIAMPRHTDWLVPVSFPAGRYVLELRKEGYNPYVTDLVIPEGLEDFEEITTINAALRKKPAAGVEATHKNLLYVRGQPPVQVSMIMHGDSQSWAVVQRLPVCDGRKWVVTEGDEIEFSRETGGVNSEKEVFERIRIMRILPDVVTIRNLLINLDYDFPIGESWSAGDQEEGAQKS